MSKEIDIHNKAINKALALIELHLCITEIQKESEKKPFIGFWDGQYRSTLTIRKAIETLIREVP